MKMSPEMKRACLFIRGFVQAYPFSASELCAIYCVLALEQAERASSGVALTVDLWLQAARTTWQWAKG